MTNISIRLATKDDFDEMVAIIKKLPYYFEPNYVKDVEDDIKNETSLLALSDGTLLGLLNYKTHSPEKAEILWMAVDPSIHSRGIGSQLMEDFLKRMKSQGIKIVEVATIASSDPSTEFAKTRRFYEKHGFREVRVDKNYYEPGDRGIMEKKL